VEKEKRDFNLRAYRQLLFALPLIASLFTTLAFATRVLFSSMFTSPSPLAAIVFRDRESVDRLAYHRLVGRP
jgi:hypothetical protein